MVLMVSGRCDIVAFYTKWFMNRYNEGYVMVRNPFNNKLVSRISFDNVDAIMFCTKNPLPIIPYLKSINKPIIFHITLTPYNKDIEPNVIDKNKIIEGIKKISNIIGIDNVYVRYDPILLSDKYDLYYHIKMFDRLCSKLNGHVNKIIISFIDEYKNVLKNKKYLKYRLMNENDYKEIGTNFSRIAKENNMTVQTCYEKNNLVEYGFIQGDCLSKELVFKLTGKKFPKWKARGKLCNCVEMVDIGVYNSCNHLCRYCYANYDESKIKDNMRKHNPNSPLLIGELASDDIIKDRG